MTQDAVTLVAPLRDPAAHAALADALRGAAFRPVAGLHFLSLFVIPPDGEYAEAYLGLEASFDGRPEDFLPALIAANGDLLDRAFGECAGYPGRERLLDYLSAVDHRYQLFYVGSPGRSVASIAQEERLAANVEAGVRRLVEPPGRRAEIVREVFNGLDAEDRYRVFNVPRRPFWVRLALLTHPWQACFCLLQWLVFLAGVPAFVLVAAAAAGSPGWPAVAPPAPVIAATICWAIALGAVYGAVTLLWLVILVWEFPARLTPAVRWAIFFARLWEYVRVSLGALPAVAALLGVLSLVHWHWKLLLCLTIAVLVIALALTIAFLIFWLARLIRIGRREPGDTVDELTWDAALARRRVREDQGPQNHFISVTAIRPGALRMATLRAVLWWIHRLARVLHNPRGLFNTQSIHFARWTILPGRRLLFASNYDGSFGGYLGIFATLGAAGVSAIWGNTVGFPRTFMLFMDGARDEQRFKRRARASQVETLLWHRRYPHLSVATIERNAAIREDLARFARGGDEVPEAELDAFLRRFSTPRP